MCGEYFKSIHPYIFQNSKIFSYPFTYWKIEIGVIKIEIAITQICVYTNIFDF